MPLSIVSKQHILGLTITNRYNSNLVEAEKIESKNSKHIFNI
jgi:hypothetical protein